MHTLGGLHTLQNKLFWSLSKSKSLDWMQGEKKVDGDVFLHFISKRCKYDRVRGIGSPRSLTSKCFLFPTLVGGANIFPRCKSSANPNFGAVIGTLFADRCFWLGGWCNIEDRSQLIRQKSKYSIQGSGKAIMERRGDGWRRNGAKLSLTEMQMRSTSTAAEENNSHAQQILVEFQNLAPYTWSLKHTFKR